MDRSRTARAVLLADAAGCAIGALVLTAVPGLWRQTGLPRMARPGVVAALAASAVGFGAAASRPTRSVLRGTAALNGLWTSGAALALTATGLKPLGIGLAAGVGLLDLGMGLAQAVLADQSER